MKLLKEFLQLGIFNSDKAYIFTVVKPGSLQYTQKIIEKFEENGWRVSKIRTKHLLSKEAHKLYAIHKKKDFYKSLCEYMSSGNSTAIIYTKDEPMSEKVFKEVKQIKDEIREKYGESDMRNVLHSSDSLEHMVEEIKIYFNMKTLNQYIKEKNIYNESLQSKAICNESLQSKAICNESILDDEEDLISSAPEVLIRDFISKNYKIYSKITINKVKDKYIVDCGGHVVVSNRKIETITNNLFEWGVVKGDFNCPDCTSLKSLNGVPKKVGGDFYCRDCMSLKSLKGSPEKVEGNFICHNCSSLKSLEGAPKEVKGYFNCSYCVSLKSLKGSPKTVGWFFDCSNCGTKFTKEDVEKVSKVKKNIVA